MNINYYSDTKNTGFPVALRGGRVLSHYGTTPYGLAILIPFRRIPVTVYFKFLRNRRRHRRRRLDRIRRISRPLNSVINHMAYHGHGTRSAATRHDNDYEDWVGGRSCLARNSRARNAAAKTIIWLAKVSGSPAERAVCRSGVQEFALHRRLTGIA